MYLFVHLLGAGHAAADTVSVDRLQRRFLATPSLRLPAAPRRQARLQVRVASRWTAQPLGLVLAQILRRCKADSDASYASFYKGHCVHILN